MGSKKIMQAWSARTGVIHCHQFGMGQEHIVVLDDETHERVLLSVDTQMEARFESGGDFLEFVTELDEPKRIPRLGEKVVFVLDTPNRKGELEAIAWDFDDRSKLPGGRITRTGVQLQLVVSR